MSATDTNTSGAAGAFQHQIVAVYENNTCAHLARDALLAAGIARSAVHVLERTGSAPVGGKPTQEDRRQSLWSALSSFFEPVENASAYHLVSDRGHAVLVVTPDPHLDRQRVVGLLEATSPLGCQPKLTELRKASRPDGLAAF